MMIALFAGAVAASLCFNPLHKSSDTQRYTDGSLIPIDFHNSGYSATLRVDDSVISQFLAAESRVVHSKAIASVSFAPANDTALSASVTVANTADAPIKVKLSFLSNFTVDGDERSIVSQLPGFRGFRLRSASNLSLTFVRPNVSDTSAFFISSFPSKSSSGVRIESSGLEFGFGEVTLEPFERRTFTFLISLRSTLSESLLQISKIVRDSGGITIHGALKFESASESIEIGRAHV
jgi:hypothetical protein